MAPAATQTSAVNTAPPISGARELSRLEALLKDENIAALIDVRTHYYLIFYFRKTFIFYELDYDVEVSRQHGA